MHRPRPPPCPDELAFIIPRGTNTWHAELFSEGARVVFSSPSNFQEDGGKLFITSESRKKADLTGYFQALELLAKVLYIGPFRNAINVGTSQNYFDIQIGQAFIAQWRSLKTGPRRKENEATYELTEDIQHIFGFDRLEINPTPNDQNIQLIIDRKSYLLTEQGAGLAQFVVVLANAAVRQPSYIFIDEPELNLHPSLQLDFLTTLGSYATEGGVVFATHNYGLARAAGDLVYSVRRGDGGARHVAPLEAIDRLAEFLGELSYAGYMALGFKKVLLVEGPSEIKTIQQFLRQLGKDHKVVLLHLGGASSIKENCENELQEVRRICEDVHAIIDSERQTEGASLEPSRVAFQRACEATDIRCTVLERRATENYFTDAAVKKVKGDNHRALGRFESLKTMRPGWKKAENWRIAREMSFDDIAETDLGKFLAAL